MLYGPEYESGKIGSLTPFEPTTPEPLCCGSCGQPVPELEPCAWDTRLGVGPCCKTHPDDLALDPETGCTPAEIAAPKRTIAHWHQMPCTNCKAREARWDSLFCSDACKRAFLTFPEVA